MHKHYKIITSVCCLLLCVGMIAFGVYAARNILTSLNSSVSFTPTTAKLKIFGGVYGCYEYSPTNQADKSDKIKYYADNLASNSSSWVSATPSADGNTANFTKWDFGKTTFDGAYIDDPTKTGPDPIYYFIQISNYVERNMYYSINVEYDVANTNLALQYGTYSSTNSTLKSSQTPNANGFWDINTSAAANAPFNAAAITTINGKANFRDFQTANKALVTPTPVIAQPLTTTMLVIKVTVENSNNDANFAFNFTITAN